jgi:hypothetical protein
MREPNAPVTPICDNLWMLAADRDFIALLDLLTMALEAGDAPRVNACREALINHHDGIYLAKVRAEERAFSAQREQLSGIRRAVDLIRAAKTTKEAARQVELLLPAERQ